MLTHVFLVTINGVRAENLGWPKTISGISFINVDQYDFRSVKLEELASSVDFKAFYLKYGRAPTSGEVGCAMAHRYCYEQILAVVDGIGLILEDDFLPDSAMVSDIIPSILEDKSFAWDVFSLKATYGLYKVCGKIKGAMVLKPDLFSFGTHAYLVKASAASVLLKAQSPMISGLADWPVNPNRLSMYSLCYPAASFIQGRSTTAPIGKPSFGHCWRPSFLDLFRFSLVGLYRRFQTLLARKRGFMDAQYFYKKSNRA
jgi:hypothetical protein